MGDVHHFTYGLVTPSVAYALSVLGSVLGLICTARLRTATTSGQRWWWLSLAAFALGGTGIWAMHFMAMLGFTVSGTLIRYDMLRTLISAVTSVVVVGLGIFIAGFGRTSGPRILLGGLLTGVGVAGMHYTGMFAMNMDGIVHYDQGLVAASVAIAVVAATVALYFTVKLSRPTAIAGAAILMGVAVCGMHYTGMAAMSVELTHPTLTVPGSTASTLLVPIGVLVLLVIGGLIYAIGAAPSAEDLAARAYLDKIQAAREEASAATAVATQKGTVRRPTAVPPRNR
ncbi:MHYT domain-containing protein [Catellatospora tritici]|uniref:MHYT domain-containing protein n=1 Tax=Catellatospora tritici TaxID=2851566 RepID=UPI001C2D7233|nr:MHYT domain-containing protein [Catellatospora tritici]MBV1852954.1 signal protein [Catellatospora tritici]